MAAAQPAMLPPTIPTRPSATDIALSFPAHRQHGDVVPLFRRTSVVPEGVVDAGDQFLRGGAALDDHIYHPIEAELLARAVACLHDPVGVDEQAVSWLQARVT